MSDMLLAMDIARPYSAVVPSLDGDVLVTLSLSAQALTGRQVAKLTPRGSQRAVSDALGRLVAHGIVLRHEVGGAYLHVLNRDHLAAPAVELLAALHGELVRRLRERIAAWDPPAAHAALFGAAVRSDGDGRSDIDLLIVRPAAVEDADPVWRSQLEALSEAVHAWTGNYARITELGEAEFERLPSTQPPTFEDLTRDAVTLTGEPSG